MRILKKRMLIWMGVVALALWAILIVALSWPSNRLERQIAAIRAAGDPVRLIDLAGEPVPPEQNGATYLRRAQKDADSLYKELTPLLEDGNIWERRPTEGELAKFASAWDAYPDILPLLEQAAACEHYDAGLDYTVDPDKFIDKVLPQVSSFRSFMRILRARGMWQLAQGRRDDAMASSILSLRLGRQFGREPVMIVGHLIAIACRGYPFDVANRVLQDGPVSAASHEALEAELLLHDVTAAYVTSLKTERAFGMESYEMIPSRNNWFVRIWDKDESTYLEIMDGYIAAAGQTYRDFLSTRSSLDAQLRSPRAPLAQLTLPAIQSVYEATVRTEAQIRCLRVLNVLVARDGEAEPGEVDPAKLGLPKDVTVDPYNGKHLVVKRVSGGWLVYSVGKNMKDDGGKFENVEDAGFGPP